MVDLSDTVLKLLDDIEMLDDEHQKEKYTGYLFDLVKNNERELEEENNILREARNKKDFFTVECMETIYFPTELRDVVVDCLLRYKRDIPVNVAHGTRCHRRKDDVIQDIISANSYETVDVNNRGMLLERGMSLLEIDEAVQKQISDTARTKKFICDNEATSESILPSNKKEIADSILSIWGIKITKGRNAFKIDYFNDMRYRTYIPRACCSR